MSQVSKTTSVLLTFALVPTLSVLFIVSLVLRCPLETWLSSSDAPSYIAVSTLIIHGVRSHNPWDERVFLGWPLMISLARAAIPAEAACVLLAVACAAAVPLLVYWYTRDINIAIVGAVISPTWILQTSLGMSEPAYLCVILAALVLVNAGNVTGGALLMGLAATIRPTALFPWLAVLFDLWKTGSPKRTVARWIALSGLVAGMTVPLNVYLYGVPFRQLEGYSTLPNVGKGVLASGLACEGAGHFGFPFRALVETPLRVHVPLWKVGFIYGHLAVVLLACGESLRTRNSASRTRIWRVSAVWALLNTAFVVCAGPYWGFHSFDRYCLWALPAYLVLLSRRLPRRLWMWIAIGICSTGLALSARWNIVSTAGHSPLRLNEYSAQE
jgi:hypothetical protein